ncbi:MAG: protein kinase [Proteobacteria bacterium]|nr:protein kinase [Pseudomonadota bacterium]
MNQQYNRRVQALFEAAIDLPVGDQVEFVRQQCGGDVELERRLRTLLAAAARPSSPFIKPVRLQAAQSRTTGVNPPPGTIDDVLGSTASSISDANPAVGRQKDWPVLVPGTRIDQYELIRELGRGGMGAVHLARDLKLGRRVAIKFLHSDRPTFTERFIAEAQHTARCNHENIVIIHDVSEYEGQPFMVLEYLRGQPLRKLMAKGAVAAARAVQLMIPVARALAFAHRQKIIHRDLKPDNIFLTDSGTVKVLDFGIAKYLFEKHTPPAPTTVTETVETARRQPELTGRGVLVGTMPYMSPEQWGADEIDFRSDLWAVGIMLYQLLVGKHPLHPLRGDQLMVTAILEQPMPSAHDAPVDIPSALADIIDGCLKKHRSERLASADALLDALRGLLPERHSGALDDDQSPYAGLAAFQEADASRFFGRSVDIATVYARTHDLPLIGVVGPSGVGKSSFVRAGIIPALKHSGEAWESFVIRPGRQPIAALAQLIGTIVGENSDEATWHVEDLNRHDEIMRRVGREPGYLGALLRDRARKHQRKIVLFVDQFEELYTLTPDITERLTFSNALTGVADDAASPLRVIVSIRSDFLDRVAEDRPFMAELRRGLHFLVQPDRAGLREAIVKPAEMAGYHFEALRMVDHMLDQLEATTGALPLLQFAATKLWETRNTAQHLLTERSYDELGGVEGALASHANALLASLTPGEQTLVRAIFLQLVTAERTRAITPMADLRELSYERPEVIQRLVNILVDARLLITNTGDSDSGALVEIVHESLIHSWPMLSHWLDENEEDAPFLEQLKAAAKQWHERGRPAGLVWRGDAAREAETWSGRYRGLLPHLHREYLDQVIALAARSARRKRLALASTIVFLSLLIVAAGVALLRISNAERAARTAYDDLKAETEARRIAEGQIIQLEDKVGDREKQVEMSREELAHANDQLQEANARLEASLREVTRSNRQTENALEKARRARKAAEKARDEAHRAEAALAVKLSQEERKRKSAERKVRRLQQKVGDILDVDPNQ